MTLRSIKSSLVVTILLSPTFDCSVDKSYAKTVSLRQPVQIIVKIDHVGVACWRADARCSSEGYFPVGLCSSYCQAQSPLPYYQVLYGPALLMDILGHLTIEGSFPPSDNFSRLERV